MECSIQKTGENIMTTKTFDDFEDRGEIAHFIVELELLKLELLDLFENYDDIIEERKG